MTVLQGIGVSQGIAIGQAFLYHPAPIEFPRREADQVVVEMARFERALERAIEEVRALHAAAPSFLRAEADRMLQVQSLLLEDPALIDRTRGEILQHRPAEQAWQEAVQTYLEVFSPIQDRDLQARVADLRDVGRRVSAALLDAPTPAPSIPPGGAILVTEILAPTEVLRLATQSVLGLCLAGGAPTAQIAAMGRALGLPTVIGLGEELLQHVSSGTLLAVDGGTGVIEIEPDETTLAYYRQRQGLLMAAQPTFDVTAPIHTADGWRVDVQVDLIHPAGLVQALARGAEGVGLIRTDFLFMGRQASPSEDEQVEAYEELLDQLPEEEVTFCTLSVGPEESLPFLAEPTIRNPLLGLRGVRLSLAYLAAFREQLRAILRATAGRPVTVVFPMAETLAEIRAAKEWLRRAQQDLDNAGIPLSAEVRAALLLQTPLAALNLKALAQEVDNVFLDLDRLTEYLLACDRNNLRVAHLFRPMHPSVLQIVGQAVLTAHRQGIRLEICGESAGHPGIVPLLLGLGVDGFCLPAERIPPAKALLGQLTVPQAQELADQAQDSCSAPEVEALVEAFLSRHNLDAKGP